MWASPYFNKGVYFCLFIASASFCSPAYIGLVMLKGVFSKRVGYLVIISGTLTLLGAVGILVEPLTILVLFGLTLGAVWQIIVGVKLYKLG